MYDADIADYFIQPGVSLSVVSTGLCLTPRQTDRCLRLVVSLGN